jgi:hypothetical protein
MAGSASLALFQKDLQDVVKGIRAQHKRGDPAGAAFISEAFAEIKVSEGVSEGVREEGRGGGI